MASQHINIHNSGVMSGNVTTAGDMNVMPGGALRVAKTTISGNLENGGTVQMNSEGGKPGNVLTVNGNYTGNNGLMTFNATLGGDNSPTDKMNVKGDTQGNTRVRVDNIGGVGAQTVNGIELIEVGGNSAGNFALTTGTVEAGAYVYTLAKGKGNDEKNWYLTSKWDGVTPADTPDPINNPPVVDPEGPSVYRPEAGSYISNIAAANSLFSHRLHDRLGEPQYTDSLHSQGSASSMWMRHVGGHERSRAGDGQLNTQANRYVLQLGGDLAQWSSNAQDRWHLGVMAGYANQHSNTQSNRVGYKSDGRISGYSAGLYATWYQNDANKTGAYVDSWALYNWFDNSVSSDNRSADDYDSRGVTASVEGGYTFEAGTFSGSEGTLNTWYVQPQAQITWMGVKDSDHTRKDGTRIETEGDGNVQTRLGVKTYLLRLPQEDMCQTFGLPSSVKYESDGGPGIARIMAFLMGSSEALKDRYDFMKFQVFQWLIGATDGHAKNFSVFIQAGGSYRLTPFYDIISAFPVLGGTGIHISDLKLAMGLNASKGKKTAIDKIYPRHFLATAKVLRFPEVQMHEILSDFARMIPAALDNVKTSLPTDFPENVVTAVESNVLRLHGRLSREYGSK
ncbi:TPA: autotransporter outer membrane beta-barrel domain-containing protein [Escherichia coli]|nr:autotransporter outer membrane beta-barrel domain-containing protein [Escherichia coli]HDP6592204.1 autotransporter outer membrane beta-barrel domain-containing protein [Escherichia coli]HDP9144379.1 autotransporter outer membrane beta-barrel domain-containing protein [Escherichia coli]HDP9479646.1 autotransporter outer membrane beta-barrel domain-containing protein [Escherichia coli]HDP9936778.1 autotransporter outer membrane beta-barrel domain-containing protein [Escherichia coli]